LAYLNTCLNWPASVKLTKYPGALIKPVLLPVIFKGAQVMQKKKYNVPVNQQILPFRKIDLSMTLELFFY
jgi:hypothetical protein